MVSFSSFRTPDPEMADALHRVYQANVCFRINEWVAWRPKLGRIPARRVTSEADEP